MIKDFIPATKFVRAVLRKHGILSDCVYTNDYEKCKTVKTYLRRSVDFDIVKRDIAEVLTSAGYPNFSFKIVPPRKGPWSAWVPSFIVRLPKE